MRHPVTKLREATRQKVTVPSSIKRRTDRLRSPRIEVPEPWVSQVSELGHEFAYQFDPIHWFDARQGYKRVGSMISFKMEGYPMGYGNLWRSRSGAVVVRLINSDHRIAFNVAKEFGAAVLDEEIENVEDDLARLIELWIFQGSDDWPEFWERPSGKRST